jgi:hypothetical protein
MSVGSHLCSMFWHISIVASMVQKGSQTMGRGGWDLLSAAGIWLDLSLHYICLKLWPKRFFALHTSFHFVSLSKWALEFWKVALLKTINLSKNQMKVVFSAAVCANKRDSSVSSCQIISSYVAYQNINTCASHQSIWFLFPSFTFWTPITLQNLDLE